MTVASISSRHTHHRHGEACGADRAGRRCHAAVPGAAGESERFRHLTRPRADASQASTGWRTPTVRPAVDAVYWRSTARCAEKHSRRLARSRVAALASAGLPRRAGAGTGRCLVRDAPRRQPAERGRGNEVLAGHRDVEDRRGYSHAARGVRAAVRARASRRRCAGGEAMQADRAARRAVRRGTCWRCSPSWSAGCRRSSPGA